MERKSKYEEGQTEEWRRANRRGEMEQRNIWNARRVTRESCNISKRALTQIK